MRAATGTARAARDYSTVIIIALDAFDGATVPETVAKLVTASDDAWFDASLFHSQTTYVIEVVDHVGSPNVQQGDFATVGYPWGYSVMYSTSFVVN